MAQKSFLKSSSISCKPIKIGENEETFIVFRSVCRPTSFQSRGRKGKLRLGHGEWTYREWERTEANVMCLLKHKHTLTLSQRRWRWIEMWMLTDLFILQLKLQFVPISTSADAQLFLRIPFRSLQIIDQTRDEIIRKGEGKWAFLGNHKSSVDDDDNDFYKRIKSFLGECSQMFSQCHFKRPLKGFEIERSSRECSTNSVVSVYAEESLSHENPH